MVKKQPQTTVDYRALDEELQALLGQLESGELDIDAAVASYERGLAIIRTLETHLQTAEQRVKLLHDAAAGDA